jgi:hypothetical protein
MGSRIARTAFEIEPRSAPERNLLLAVLRRAVLDYRGSEPEVARAAREWFSESLNEPFPSQFSFPWVCDQLDIAPSSVLSILNSPHFNEFEAGL